MILVGSRILNPAHKGFYTIGNRSPLISPKSISMATRRRRRRGGGVEVFNKPYLPQGTFDWKMRNNFLMKLVIQIMFRSFLVYNRKEDTKGQSEPKDRVVSGSFLCGKVLIYS